MKKIILSLVAMCMISLFGCAHSPPRCTVATSHSPTEFDICMGSKEFKQGDRLIFYKSHCSPPSRGTPKKCKKVKIGEGLVLNILDEHLSTVKLDSEFEINQGTTIERQ